MQIISPQLISGKKVLLRLDIDVPIENGQVTEDFRLRAGLPTIHLCLEHALQVIIMGHIGRPEGQIVKELSVEPIKKWLSNQGLHSHLTSEKLKILENLRFDSREEAGDISFAKELANMGDVFVNEAFASYRPASSTTVLPTILPHAAGLRFAEEVEKLKAVRENPKKPYVAIMGGAKVADKLPVIKVLAQKADAILVGGKLISEIRAENLSLPKNVLVGMLNEDGFDIAPQTISAWVGLIRQSRMIVWNGPVGRIEDPNLQNKTEENFGSARGTYELARIILESKAEVIIGGGDTVGFLGKIGLLEKFEQKGFVSTGGGAMLKFLTDGTLPTIEALS
ncbi:MAG: phosphoglycerate kinase [Candidatus Daviesbacteria bacterium]|nr:phosphoglycerate kinase [Candidatus Daviesbacteria bacterium]